MNQDKQRYIKCGTCYRKASDYEGTPHYILVKFRSTTWILAMAKEFEERINEAIRRNTTADNEGRSKITYSVKKKGQYAGIAVPRFNHNDELYHLIILNKKGRKYFVFDVDEKGMINDKAPIYFDIASDAQKNETLYYDKYI